MSWDGDPFPKKLYSEQHPPRLSISSRHLLLEKTGRRLRQKFDKTIFLKAHSPLFGG